MFFHPEAKLSKLFTKQDPFYIHKILGFLSLSSFVYRYVYVYNDEGTLGMDGSTFDWITMATHTALSLSAIMFHVPKKRIKDKPMIIYEEYRLHAMIFTIRCFSVFAISVLYPDRPWYVTPIVVALHHYQADRITDKYGTPGNTAVRSTSEKIVISGVYKNVSKLYSLYQFLAIGSHIVISDRSGDLAYNALIAIQSSSFMMTLYRKKIIKGKTHMLFYSSCLVVSSYHIVRLLDLYTIFLIFCTFIIRTNTPINKYILWSGFLAIS